MANITTRAGKGSPLTNAEVDGNFTNLNNELATKADSSALSGYQPALGYTPANRAGDTFTGLVNFDNVNVAGTNAVWSGHSYTNTWDGSNVYQYIGTATSTNKTWNLRVFNASNGYATFTFNHAGVAVAENSFRAPLFYDSNDTNYFIDPASSSSVNTLYASILSAQSSSDAQLYLNGNGTSWAGISWSDVSNTDYMFYNGSTSTFSIGGGGSAVANKKLHINGGVTIGSSSSGSAVAANGLYVQFRVDAPLYYDSEDTSYAVDPNSTSVLNAIRFNSAQYSTGNTAMTLGSTYFQLNDPTGRTAVFLGGADPANYYDNSQHNFRDRNGSQYAFINSNGVYAASFVDTNDNAYYVNPASNSNLWFLSLASTEGLNVGGIRGRLSGGSDGQGIHLFSNVDIGYPSGWGDGLINTPNRGLSVYGGGRFSYGGTGFLSADTSVRAPIFYDTDNTAFYADLANNTLLSALRARGQIRATGWWDSYSGSVDGLGVEIGQSGNRGFVLSYNRNASTYGPLSFEANDFQFNAVSGGYAQINTSFRAPIFYDTDNTGYYVDPHSTSVLLNLNLNGGLTANGSITVGNGSASSDIYMSDSDEGTRRIHCNSNQIGFLNQAGNWGSFCADDGGWYSDNYVSAPIFYDRNDSNFYVDPHNTSNINGLLVSGGSVYRSDWTTRFQSSSDFVDGTLVSTNIPATASSGESFIIEITGKSYDGSNPPFKVVAQGYLYNDTIINVSGISYGGNFASSIKVFEDGGVLKFWWPRISYWNSFNVSVMGMDGPNSGTITRNRVVSITNSTEPTGTKKQTIGLARFMRADTGATNSSALFAPIFYDANDTSRYVDAAGVSNLDQINLGDGSKFIRGGSSGQTILGVGDVNSAFLQVGGNYYSIWNSGNFDPASKASLGSQNTFTSVNYFFSGGNPQSGTNPSLQAWTNDNASGAWMAFHRSNQYAINMGLDSSNVFRIGGWSASANLFAMDMSGNLTLQGSSRAPIFYDSDNTNFYTDPASTSNLNGLTVGGRNMRSFESNSYIEFTVGGDANTYYPVLIQPSTVWYHFANWSISRGYADTAPWDPIGTGSHRGGLTFTWQWSGDSAWGGNDKSYRVIQFAEQYTTMVGGMTLSVNGMIVWLRGGGAYYRLHGPAGMTNSVAVTLGTYTASDGATFPARSYVSSNVETEIMNRFPIRHSGTGTNLWDGGTRVLSEDRWINSKYFSSSGSIYSSIVYDSNDSGYYADPNNLSRMSAIAVEGRVSIAEGQYLYMGGTATVEQNWGSRAWTTGGNHYSNARSHTFDNNGYGSTYSFVINSTGNVTASVDLRSPLFYDSDNTAYYVDGAGNSVFNTLWLRNSSGVSLKTAYASNFGYSSSYRTIVLGNDSLTTISMGVDVSGNASGSFNGNGEGREVLFRNGVNFVTPNAANNDYLLPFGMADGYAYSSGSFRAPIFYDTDNTGFYINPQSGSVLGGQVSFAGGTYVAVNGDVYARRDSGTTGVYYFANGGSKYLYWDGNGYIFGSDGWVFSNTPFQSYASVRAPIFYDSNNTGYYVDAADSSNLNGLSLTGSLTVGAGANSSFIYMADSDEGTRIVHCNSNQIGFLTQGGSWGAFCTDDGGWYSNAATYSPIYYDLSNSGYYIDGASTSVLNTLLAAGGVGLYDSNNDPYGKLSVTRSSGANYTYLGFTRSGQTAMGMGIDTNNAFWIGSTSAGYDGVRAGTWLSINGSGQVTATGDLRSPLFYDSDNTGYYVDPNSTSRMGLINADNLRAYGNVYADGNYGSGLVGAYSSYRYQGVFAMGDSYKLPADGTTTGSLYGIAWSHPNTGGVAANLSSHGALIMENGTFLAALSGSIRCRDDMRAPLFYDSNNTGYYVDPNSNTYLYSLVLSGGTYFQPNSWIQFNGAYGVYWPNNNDAHLVATTNASYGQIEIRGSRSGYGGIFDLYSGVNGIMYDGAGNGGVYREANGRWYFYHNVANNCTGFGTSTTVSGWSVYVPAGVYSDSRIDASLFYDVSNTAFYLDPNTTGTSLNVAGSIVAAGNVTAYSDIRVKDNIETVSDALIRLRAIRGVTYTRTDLDDKERRYAGVIAQEIEKALPEAVFGDNQKRVDYNGTIALLIEAVKELKAELDELKAQTCH